MINRDDYKSKEPKPYAAKMTPSEPEIVDERPTVLLIGINAVTYSSRGILKGIEALGYRPEFLDWQRIKLDETIIGLRDRAIMKAKMCSPEFIICHIQNPEAMLPETFGLLEAIAPVVNLNLDCREEVSWMIETAPLISLTCFSNEEDVRKCKDLGIENVISLHSSCNYDFYKSSSIVFKRDLSVKEADIVFIGTNLENSNVNFPLAKNRQEMVEFLYQTYPNQFSAYGMGQKVSKYINEFEELALYQNAKIVIGHNNFLRENYSSDRLWRAMGSGAFFLSSYFPGIEKTFEREIHLDYWSNFFELKNLIDFYLANDFERNSIAQLGCQFVREKHTWQDRIQVMVNNLKMIKHG